MTEVYQVLPFFLISVFLCAIVIAVYSAIAHRRKKESGNQNTAQWVSATFALENKIFCGVQNKGYSMDQRTIYAMTYQDIMGIDGQKQKDHQI